MEYKKSYKGFVLFLLAYIALMCAPVLLPGEDYALMTRLCLNATIIGVAGLMAIIWRTEQVYWINGVTFEQARDAGSERRRAFALAHLVRIGYAAAGYALFSIIAQACGISWWFDLIVWCVALFGAAISTMNIKL